MTHFFIEFFAQWLMRKGYNMFHFHERGWKITAGYEVRLMERIWKIFFWGHLFLFLVVPPTQSAETVLFGINVPLTGSYSRQGEDELRAYKLAIRVLNDRGGILGKKIVYSVKDSRTDAEEARKNAKEFILDGAVLVTGGSSSAEAIAQSEECQKGGVVFMAALTHSNETTGKDGHRHTFRWYSNAHQSAKALARTLTRQYGEKASYVYIYADYTWGRTVLESLQTILEKSGGKTLRRIPTKLGEKSFISELLQAKIAGPDVLVLVQFGQDMMECLQQATALELRKKMAVVVPLMDIHMAEPLGPEIMEGVIVSLPWYHGLADIYAGSRKFVEIFEQEYRQKPGTGAAAAWVDIFQYAEAVERAKSFDHYQVIKTLEGHHFQLLFDDEYWRDWDHQGIHPTFVAVGKTHQEAADRWDLFRIIGVYQGEDLAQTREENPVQLEPIP
jgi:branched-chain amino acid transport system substrate-binding protein